MKHTNLAIIGGGPAGLAAAHEACSRGLSVCLLDEQTSLGGQIYRNIEQVTERLPRRAHVLGKDYQHGAELIRLFRNSGALYLGESLVWHIEAGHLWYLQQGQVKTLEADRILIATGAIERPVPLPGWTLPGVMTVGAAQILLKSGGIIPASDTILVGHGPLLFLFAQQLLAAGGTIKGIVETVPSSRYLQAMRHLPKALGSGYLSKGIAMMQTLRRGGIRFYRNAEDIRIEGTKEAERVSFRSGRSEHSLDASNIFLHEGVVPNTQLTRLVGCDHVWDDDQQCFKPVLDQWGNTSVEGVLVAGDGAGIGGALAAEEAGRLAALEVAHALGALDRPTRDQHARQPLARLRKQMDGRRFLQVLYAPSNALPRRSETIVCRCEEVTAGQVRSAVQIGGKGPNQVKSYLRCGMGPCQGRMCGLTVSAIIADELGVSMQEVGYFRIRPPLKPVPLAAIAHANLPPDMQVPAA